jgi:branched-chain amino acid transport system ATP-binding protein
MSIPATDVEPRHDAASASPSILALDRISLTFGGVTALQNVSFEVPRGRLTSIIGPNGAGKTSLLNVISGVYAPTAGHIVLEDTRYARLSPHRVAALGIARTFQNIALFRGMTVHENVLIGRNFRMKASFLACGLGTRGAAREEAEERRQIQGTMAFLELDRVTDAAVETLPYGIQKRVELARALALEPRLLLLDEPMAGMTADEKRDMVRFILKTAEKFNSTIVLIEHDMGIVMNISDEVIVLDYGQKIAEGPPAEVRRDPAVVRAYLGESA